MDPRTHAPRRSPPEATLLVEQNLRLVWYCLRRLRGVHQSLEDDLLSDGLLGLWRAALLYDEAAGVTFAHYAVRSIHHRMCRFLTQRRARERHMRRCLTGLQPWQWPAARDRPAAEEAAQRDACDALMRLVGRLTRKERLTLARLAEGHSQTDVARELGVSCPRVGAIRRCAVARLQARMAACA